MMNKREPIDQNVMMVGVGSCAVIDPMMNMMIL